MNRVVKIVGLVLALTLGAMTQTSSAGLIVTKAVGGAPTGVTVDNLNWLTLGATGGTSPTTGIVVDFTPDAAAVQGSVSGVYTAPYLSGSNGTAFGQASGVDTSTYITTGSTGSFSNAQVQILLPGPEMYFGLLWGSVDAYNTLEFLNGNTVVGTLTGSDILASPTGDQGVNGTVYVNITSSVAFDRVVATSSQYAFEFDDLAFNPTVVPEPASMLLVGIGLAAIGTRRYRRR